MRAGVSIMRALVKAGQDRASPMDVYRSREASEANIVLLYAREDERQMGALIEAGCALGAGKQVYLVAPWAKWSFRFHPRMRCFDTLEHWLPWLRRRLADICCGRWIRARAVGHRKTVRSLRRVYHPISGR